MSDERGVLLPIALPVTSSSDAEIAAFVALARAKVEEALLQVVQVGTGVVVFVARDGWGEVLVSTSPETAEALGAKLTRQ